MLALVATLGGAAAAPLFPNSIVSNDIDFIRPGDPASPHCLSRAGRDRREMPGGPGGDLFADGVHVFAARFGDDTVVELWAHPDLGAAGARRLAERVAPALAHLPTAMRATLSHVILHPGDRTAFAEHLGHFFVLYEGNVADRMATRDLEETLFHEAVHATLDAALLDDPDWRRAQRADGAFVTDYARRHPAKEDLAESALFAHALIATPGRLSPDLEAALRRTIPARIAFFERLAAQNGPLIRGPVAGEGLARAC